MMRFLRDGLDENLTLSVGDYFARKDLPLDIAVTFRDVTIVDLFSTIPHRSDVDTSVDLGKGVQLRRPIFSSNMWTITESSMAIAMARLGGCGTIHQFMSSIERRVAEVKKVKRADSFVVKNPLTISPDDLIADARRIVKENNDISGLLVVDKNDGTLLGILSERDIRWAEDSMRVKEKMTPREKLVVAPEHTSLEEARRILDAHRLEKLPLIRVRDGADLKSQCSGMITASDILKLEKYPFAFRDKKGRLGVAAAVGIGEKALGEIGALLEAETDIIVIDTARGNSESLRRVVIDARKTFGENFLLVAGNVDTPAGVKMLIEAGADVVKVGIGSGSVCSTREGPGVGIPQITAVAAAAAVARVYHKKVISDGGIVCSADYCKALAAGADAVMIGGLFGATEETPGRTIIKNGKPYKLIMGSASTEFQILRTDRDTTEADLRAPEGEIKYEPLKGSVEKIVWNLVGHQLSSMSYVGAENLEAFHEKSYFGRITPAGFEEGKPHDVQ